MEINSILTKSENFYLFFLDLTSKVFVEKQPFSLHFILLIIRERVKSLSWCLRDYHYSKEKQK